MYQRLKNRNKYAISDKNGIFEEGELHKKKRKDATLEPSSKLFNSNEDFTFNAQNSNDDLNNSQNIMRVEQQDLVYGYDYESNDVFLEMSISDKLFQLSGHMDTTQVYIVQEEDTFCLVIIKKVLFKDKNSKFISGCSMCVNLNSDFLLFLEASKNYDSKDCYCFAQCKHIHSALSDILNNFGGWKSTISTKELQSFLSKNLFWEKDAGFFVSEKSPDFCGSLCSIEGIILFLKKSGEWKCGACQYKSVKKCRHGQKHEYFQQTDQIIELDDPDLFKSKWRIISDQSFSLKSLQNIFYKRAFNLDFFLKTEFICNNDIYSVVPEIKHCCNCKTELVLQQMKVPGFILLNIMLKCDVFYGECPNQSCKNYLQKEFYKGTKSGIMNFGNKFFIGAELVKEYLDYYARDGLSFHAWFNTKLDQNNCLESLILQDIKHISSYSGALHEAFCLTSMLFTFNKETFFCCNPSVIVMDATGNGVKKSRMLSFKTPWIQKSIVKRFTNRAERQIEPLNKKWKELVIKILKKEEIVTFDVLNDMRRSNNIGLKTFSYCFQQNQSNQSYVLHNLAFMFGNTLTKTVAAVNTIIPENCVVIIKQIIQYWKVESHDLIVLKVNSPTIYGLFIAISTNNESSKEAEKVCKDLLLDLINKRHIMFDKPSQTNENIISSSDYKSIIENLEPKNLSAPSFEMLELLKTGCFFPGYPVLKSIIDIRIPGEQFECNKNYLETRTMSPGTLYFFCGTHEKCLGFVVLDKPESLRIVTQIILTRFSVMPSTIIYDNGCNLNEFVMNRYPLDFQNSRIFVDGFHFNSHNNCSVSYDSSSHPELTKQINTSLCEQKNSRYSKMKPTSPFLKLTTFMAKVRYAMMFYNQKPNK